MYSKISIILLKVRKGENIYTPKIFMEIFFLWNLLNHDIIISENVGVTKLWQLREKFKVQARSKV